MTSNSLRIASVTSTVFPSGSFKTPMPKLGTPLVREMLEALLGLTTTVAISDSKIGLGKVVSEVGE